MLPTLAPFSGTKVPVVILESLQLPVSSFLEISRAFCNEINGSHWNLLLNRVCGFISYYTDNELFTTIKEMPTLSCFSSSSKYVPAAPAETRPGKNCPAADVSELDKMFC